MKIFPYKFIQNKITDRIVFKIKTSYKLELLTPQTMRSLGSSKNDVDKEKDGENVPKLESVEVFLVHCNLVKNDYQHTSKVLFTFVPKKQFGQLINISPHSLTMMNTVNAEFSSAEVWFKNNAPCINCISKNNGVQIDNAEDLDVVMPMYSLLECSKNYRKITGSLWNFYRDEPSNLLSSNSESFKYKASIAGNTYDSDYDADKVGKNEAEIVVPIKILKKFLEKAKYSIN